MTTSITIVVFVMALKTLILANCDFNTATPYFQKSVNEFTMKLVRRIYLETDGHFVVSALTPWTLLTAMSLDVTDKMLQEIQKVLQMPLHRCAVHLYLELANQVKLKPNNHASSNVEHCSMIFFNSSLNINQSFFDVASEGGIENSRIMYFMYRNNTARWINYQVRMSTDDAIVRVISEDDLVNLTTIMIDALSFRSAWKYSFPYEDIETAAFYDDEGQQIGDVSMMYLTETFNMTKVSEIQATVLELPYYGDVNKYSMLIFVPEPKTTLTTMLHLMEAINISSIFHSYELQGSREVTVQIPRFNMTSIYHKWREFLTGLGINTIFNQQEPDFSSLSHYQLFLTNFRQQVELEVNEEGIEIGRAKVTLMESRFMYDQFVANKPFMYMIVDRILHVSIFTGAYSKPSIINDSALGYNIGRIFK